MAKKTKNTKIPKANKKYENIEILDEKEQKNAGYSFIAVFVSSIVFLLVYLSGLISILFK